MIKLRPRQEEMVRSVFRPLEEHGNTLCVAPTGAGKTIMLSAIIKDYLGKGERCLVIQHTDEILEQNLTKFKLVSPEHRTSIVNGKTKDFSGEVIFSMVQSLQKEKILPLLPKVDFLVIDEAHHAVAPGYRKILDQAKLLNPCLPILGMTATPMRADRQALGDIFTNVADQITIEELVASGDLLYPKTFVIESDIQEKIKRSFVNSNNNEREVENLIPFSKKFNYIIRLESSKLILEKRWPGRA